MTRLVFMGTPEFAVPSLAALLDAGYDVVGVLTKEDQPAGRGQKLEESPIKQLAQAHGLDDPTAAHAARRRSAGRVGRPRAGRDRRRGLRPDPAARGARLAPLRVHQRPRLGAAALARGRAHRRGHPCRRRGGRRQHHADGCRGRHRPDAQRGVSAHRRRRHDGHAHPEARQPGGRSAGADAAALAGRRAHPPPATGRGRHLGPAHYKGRWTDRLVRAGSVDRAPRARLPALADGVHALEWAGAEGIARAGGSGDRRQGTGVRRSGVRNQEPSSQERPEARG